MQRLRDQASSSDPATARAAELLSAMPPLDPTRLRRRSLPPVEAGSRGFAGKVGTTMVLAITLGTVAATAATIHRVGWPVGFLRSLEQPTSAPQPTAAPATHRAHPSSGQTPSTAWEPVPETAPVPPDSQPGAPRDGAKVEHMTGVRGTVAPLALRSSPSGVGRTAPKESSPAEAAHGAAPSPAEDESALMVGAVRALRRDGDPARAQALAEEVLQRYPNGMQVEEAMALVMEAAAARGDGAGARRAAQRYLDGFSAGRFADRAKRILEAQPR